MADKLRLNYTLSERAYELLNTYRDQTGRKPTEVVRQLLVEYVQGFLEPINKPGPHPDGPRQDVYLMPGTVEMAEARATNDGYPSLSALIDRLTQEFVTGRIRSPQELVTVKLQIPLNFYAELAREGAVEDVILRRLEESRAQQQPVEEAA